MPESAMPLAVTFLPDPTFLSLKIAVPVTVNVSPETRLSEYTTLAVVVRSYTLSFAVIVTNKDREVMFAVVVVEMFCV